MIKNKENEKYLKMALAAGLVLIIGMIVFFLFYRIRGFSEFLSDIIGILEPFIFGFVIAYVLKPTCSCWERHLEHLLMRIKVKHSKSIASGLSITLCELMAVFVAYALVMMIIPQVATSIASLVGSFSDQLDSTSAWLHDFLERYPTVQQYWDQIYGEISPKIKDWLQSDLSPMIQTILGGLGSQVVNVFSIFKNLFLGMIVSIYLLANRRRFKAQAKLILYSCLKERWAEIVRNEAIYADRMFSGFLMGKLLDSAIIGVICFVGTTLMGIKSALLVSVVIGVTNIIPFFGPFIGVIPSALWLLLESPIHCISFIIFIIILQQVDGNIIGPKILGNSTGLSSFWVLFSILFFGGLWGFVGMIIGVPLFAVIYDIITRLVVRGLKHNQKEELLEQYEEQFVAKPQQVGEAKTEDGKDIRGEE